jgi:ribonuclease Z
MKRILLILGAIVLLAGLLLYLFRGPLALRIYEAGVRRAVGVSTLDSLPDGLSVAFCGTGAPLPDPDRAGPCTAVIAGKRVILVDAGEGSARNLGLMGIPAGKVERILLTHFHSDHIDGLGPVMLQRWVNAGATAPLTLMGPSGVEDIAAGFNAAYARDAGYRVAHHGAGLIPPAGFGVAPLAFAPPAESAVILDEGGLKITAFRVNHEPVVPAVGYRFDYKGRCVTISGDTTTSAVLTRAAAGCDLLVHEGLQPRLTRIVGAAAADNGNAALAKIMADIESYHAAPERVAEEAATARVGALAFTHIVPPLRVPRLLEPGLDQAFLGEASRFFSGPIWIARDGDIVSLPPGGGLERRRAGRI